MLRMRSVASSFFLAFVVVGVVPSAAGTAPVTPLSPAGTITTKISDVRPIGDDPGIAIGSDGLPIIATRDVRVADLAVVKCHDIACTSSTIVKIKDDRRIGYETSIAIGTDGLPVIAHRDSRLGDLLITKCSDLGCAASSTTRLSDVDRIGLESSIAIGSDGFPVISHLDSTVEDLVVTKCGNRSCTSSTTVKIPDAHDTGHQSAIAIGVDGLPVISHHDGNPNDLAVTKCNNLSCSSNSTVRISNPDRAGDDSGIAIGADGLPVISYRIRTQNDLGVTKCGNAACTSGNTTTKIAHPNKIGRDTSIAVPSDGRPVISHRDLTLLDLVVTKCGNPACSSGNTTTWVPDPNNTGKDTSIAIGVDDLPIIAHWDIDLGDLAVTKCGDPACALDTGPARVLSGFVAWLQNASG